MWLETAAALEREGFFPDVAVRIVRIFGVGELQVGPSSTGCRTTWSSSASTSAGRGRRARPPPPGLRQPRRRPTRLVAALEAGVRRVLDDGRTVDDVVADGLRERGLTLAVAESCTGGLLGARLTERPGSSDYFVGGVISYANEVKMGLLDVPAGMLAQYGAVSEQVAGAMAEGARAATGSDYALAVSGVAGPDGGTPDKPVGLGLRRLRRPRGHRVREGSFPGDRDSVRTFAATSALHLLRAALPA